MTRLPVPARLRGHLLAAACAAVLVTGTMTLTSLNADAAAPPVPTGWTQTFLEDFPGTALSGNWRVSEGTSYPGGPANFRKVAAPP